MTGAGRCGKQRTIRPHHGHPERAALDSADTALRLGGYLGNNPQFWLELQSQHDIAVVEGERGEEIARRVKPAGAA